MKQLKFKVIFLNFMLLLLFYGGAKGSPVCQSISKDKAEIIAKYNTDIIVAGRGIVAEHQDLINDPSKADKGFTPQYVERLIRERFKEMNGKDISELDPEIRGILEEVINAAKLAVKKYQKRINQPGIGFKGFIPAVFGRETGQILKAFCNISIKQTTFKYRNSYNKPDEFEKEILRIFKKPDYPKGEGYGKMVGNKYRYLRPIYIKKACLKCHGEPKGAKDIAGRIKEGYKVGDVRGAISIMFPVN